MPKVVKEPLKPYWSTADGKTCRLYHGDSLEVLHHLPDKIVQTVVTSPPYWKLRDYKTGDSRELGSEPTVTRYVRNLCDILYEVRRVLRDDGTLWLNLGDTFLDGNLQLIPHQVALALQDVGWVLRNEIIWHKPSPMPEPTRNRCTRAHETIFLLTKVKSDYFFDPIGIREPSLGTVCPGTFRYGGKYTHHRSYNNSEDKGPKNDLTEKKEGYVTTERNKRSVWEAEDEQAALYWLADNHPSLFYEYVKQTENCRDVWKISSEGYSGGHFATFPKKLAELCVKAGTSEHGCCSECGMAYVRLTEEMKIKRPRPNDYVKRTGEEGTGNRISNSVAGLETKTIGWEKQCTCPVATAQVQPCLVMDPFMGAGTTAVVSITNGRHVWGIELGEKYLRDNAIPRIVGELMQRPNLKWLAGVQAKAVEGGRSLLG